MNSQLIVSFMIQRNDLMISATIKKSTNWIQNRDMGLHNFQYLKKTSKQLHHLIATILFYVANASDPSDAGTTIWSSSSQVQKSMNRVRYLLLKEISHDPPPSLPLLVRHFV